jgi:hypothetical protein
MRRNGFGQLLPISKMSNAWKQARLNKINRRRLATESGIFLSNGVITMPLKSHRSGILQRIVNLFKRLFGWTE